MSDNDIINLNVGGTKLTTLRSTLCQVEDSLLATMFSGRWEDNIKRDQDGAVFFDFNPQHFILILDYLRVKKIATPQNPPPLPKVPEDQEECFNSLVQYLGLTKEITVPCEITTSLKGEKFSFYRRSHGISLKEGRKLAICDEDGYEYVLGENVYNEGTVNLKLKLESYWQYCGLHFIGITEGDVKLLTQNMNALSTRNRNISYEWPGTYGWVFCARKSSEWQVCKDGTCMTDYNFNEHSVKHYYSPHTLLELVLDCEAGKVSLQFPAGMKFHIDIPKARMWRLNVTLKPLDGRICIVDD